MRSEKDKIKVDIALADEHDFKHRGEVDFIDNQLDPSTGTLRYRAEVKNKDRFITPGMFVRLRFPIGKPEDAVLVPEEAIATDQGQHSIFVINAEDKVESRPVTLGILFNGLRVIANDDVQENERVVVSGLQRIRNGSKVAPQDRDGEREKDEEKVAKSEK